MVGVSLDLTGFIDQCDQCDSDRVCVCVFRIAGDPSVDGELRQDQRAGVSVQRPRQSAAQRHLQEPRRPAGDGRQVRPVR